jgi:hypothetical protein
MELIAKGRLGASVRFDGQTVTVAKSNRLMQGYGERSAHISQIAGVRWQKPGLITREGYIGFTVAGVVAPRARIGSQINAARGDDWHVTFFRGRLAEFEAIRDAVQAAVSALHQGPTAGPLGGNWGPPGEARR